MDQPLPAALKELLKEFMRQAAQQVYLVTAASPRGFAAITASSVTSISLEPPLMMVAVAKNSRNHEPLVSAEHFIISILGEDGVEAASVFAEQADPKEKLERVGYTDTGWGPVPKAARGFLALRRWAAYDGGDHTILLGEVVGGETSAVDCPLLYHNRRYTSVKNCK